jgi:hypothetical protein
MRTYAGHSYAKRSHELYHGNLAAEWNEGKDATATG